MVDESSMQALRPSLIQQQAEPGARTESGMLRQGWFQNDLYSDDADPNLHNPRCAAKGLSTESRVLGYGFSTDSNASLVQAASALYVAGFFVHSLVETPRSCTFAAGHVMACVMLQLACKHSNTNVQLPCSLASICTSPRIRRLPTALWPHSCRPCQSKHPFVVTHSAHQTDTSVSCVTLFSC